MTDKSKMVWAAPKWIPRQFRLMPLESFSHYDGLQGNPLCVLSFGSDVYVGTSSGLFKLVQEEVYDEIVSYVDVEVKTDQKKGSKKSKENVKEAVTDPSTGNEPINESKKRGFLRFLKRKKTKSEDGPPNNEAEPSKPTPSGNKTYESQRKVERVLRSAHYTYKKVKGVDAKVTQLIEANGHLIAAGLSGAFEVQGLIAKPILEEPASSVFPSSESDMLFISTYKNEMKTFRRNNNGWVSEGLFDELDDEISFMFQSSKGRVLALCHRQGLREIVNGDIRNIQTIAFPNPNFDEVVGTAIDDKIVLANSNGFFHFDRDKGSFIRVDSLGELSHYFAANGNIWFRDSHDWNAGKKPGRNLHLLNLYKDLRFVTSDADSENLWLITANNELYKFFTDQLTAHEVDHPLMLKAIRNAKQRVSRRGEIQFDQEKSSVTFEVIQPDYLAAESTEYRFQLNKLGEKVVSLVQYE